jgi:tRNA threonylcarbamoyl adenosine modification protein YeaZ
VILAVETSSILYGAVLCTPQRVIASRTLRRDDPAFAGIGALVAEVLALAGKGFADIESLAVNAGPGNLGSIRAGVAYVNGLGFSLGRPILGANSLRLLALEVDQPSALCLRNAGGGEVYAGVFPWGRMRHGPLATVVPALAGGLAEVAVAGSFRAEAIAALPGVSAKDSGIEYPDVLTLPRLLSNAGEDEWVDVVSPINEGSAVFHE